MLEKFIIFYFFAAISICLLGLARNFTRYGWLRFTMPREMVERAATPYPADRQSLLAALWQINIKTGINIWWKNNPPIFMGHVLYHLGLFTALGIYAFVAAASFENLSSYPFKESFFIVCEWFNCSLLLMELPFSGWLRNIFFLSILFACLGITIPFVMSVLGLRGMIRPMDKVMAAANIRRVAGLPTVNSSLGWQRKVIGLLALSIDWSMLMTFLFPKNSQFACTVHILFALTILILLPFSFLFHEIYRLRMWGGVLRARDGRTA